MITEERFSLAGMGLLAAGLFAALLTWLCVGWFGNQSLFTALVAVVLVEVLLASFVVIALLLTERMTMVLLKSERRQSATPPPRRRAQPIWFRLPDPIPGTQPRPNPQQTPPATISFPRHIDQTPSDSAQWRGRAA